MSEIACLRQLSAGACPDAAPPAYRPPDDQIRDNEWRQPEQGGCHKGVPSAMEQDSEHQAILRCEVPLFR